MKPSVFLRGSATAQQRRVIMQAARAALADQQVSLGTLAIVLVDRPRMQELNSAFAGLDQPTDVLSFPDGSADPGTGELYLGDVVICLPIALEQAAAAGRPAASELRLLTVHGVLHLLGHDHDSADAEQHMWAAQGRILSSLGVAEHTTA